MDKIEDDISTGEVVIRHYQTKEHRNHGMRVVLLPVLGETVFIGAPESYLSAHRSLLVIRHTCRGRGHRPSTSCRPLGRVRSSRCDSMGVSAVDATRRQIHCSIAGRTTRLIYLPY